MSKAFCEHCNDTGLVALGAPGPGDDYLYGPCPKCAAEPDTLEIPDKVLQWIADAPTRPGPRTIVYIDADCSKPMYHADELARFTLGRRDFERAVIRHMVSRLHDDRQSEGWRNACRSILWHLDDPGCRRAFEIEYRQALAARRNEG